MNKPSDFIATNRANWDERADLHFADETGYYRIEDLLAGADLLGPIESAELPDLAGKRVAHFQCHIGTDSLSLARRGAAEVAGIDFSARAIAHAWSLAAATGLPARFAQGFITQAPALLGGGFDLVYTSWGTIVWIAELAPWAQAIAACLRPGGQFYYLDSHPYAWTLAGDGKGGAVIASDYETAPDRPLPVTVAANYNFSPRPLVHRATFQWHHSLSSMLNALVSAGLVIERLNEHDCLPWLPFEGARQGEDGLWRLSPDFPRLPLSLSILARKPG